MYGPCTTLRITEEEEEEVAEHMGEVYGERRIEEGGTMRDLPKRPLNIQIGSLSPLLGVWKSIAFSKIGERNRGGRKDSAHLNGLETSHISRELSTII